MTDLAKQIVGIILPLIFNDDEPELAAELEEAIRTALPVAQGEERLREAMRDAAEFWAHYSAVNESCQDKMNNGRLAMLERMEALAAGKEKK